MKAFSERQRGDLGMHVGICKVSKSGGKTPWHKHPEVHLMVVLEGEFHLSSGGKELNLAAGEGAFVNSGVSHCEEPAGRGSYMTVDFLPEFIISTEAAAMYSRYIASFMKSRDAELIPLRDSEWAEEVCRLAGQIRVLHQDKCENYEFKSKILLCQIWLKLYENSGYNHNNSCNVSFSEKKRIDTLCKFIQDNYVEHITLDDIAGSAHISRGECCRIFKRLYNITPFQYLVRYRLTRSVSLLAETDSSISQIAQSVGFCSSSYYTKCFRKEYNCTPLKYRQNLHRLSEIRS